MREYFTVVIKENSTENMGLLTEKLNDGFGVDRFYEVGKMGVFILEKHTHSNTRPTLAEGYVVENSSPTIRF
jgi:hypothetical protein